MIWGRTGISCRVETFSASGQQNKIEEDDIVYGEKSMRQTARTAHMISQLGEKQ
jgi:hypothetical protein